MTDSSQIPRRKLIEHSLPLDAINAANKTKNKAPKGYPTKLHTYWAHRPLATCRAVLFAQLVDDPSAWPDRFPTEEEQDRERRRLHKVIEAMVEWPKSAEADQKRFEAAIEAARWEIARSTAWSLGEEPPARDEPTAVLAYIQERAPPVYDPFCGGGSIPLEAQRLGLSASGSDLNPIAVLITKALIEFPPKFNGWAPVHPDVVKDADLVGRIWKGAQGLAEDVRRYGAWMNEEAKRRVGHLYPKAILPGGGEATVTAWLWARTVASPDPAQQGAHVPLASSFVLSSKAGKETIVIPKRNPAAKDGWCFEVKTIGITKAELKAAQDGTKAGKGQAFICILSNAPIERSYIQVEGKAQRLGVRLMAIVIESEKGRGYLSPTTEHELPAAAAANAVDRQGGSIAAQARESFLSGPTPTRAMVTGGVCSAYGLATWGHLFTDRQIVILATLSDLVREARQRVLEDAAKHSGATDRVRTASKPADASRNSNAYADAVALYLYCVLSRLIENQSSLVTWRSKDNALRSVFGRQAMPMTWDFAEANPFAISSGAIRSATASCAEVIEVLPAVVPAASASVDAPKNSYPVKGGVITTDPPYYDNVGYADLSDYFYGWMRRSLSDVFPELTRRLVTPKDNELVATPYRFASADRLPDLVRDEPEVVKSWALMSAHERAEAFFMAGMRKSISAMRAASSDAIPISIYYAFKQSEENPDGISSPGWAAFLQAVVDSGLQVDGTWPVRTEASNRSVGNSANALASSVVLVCRKRGNDAPTTGRREFLRELKPIMAQAILDHQRAGVPLPDRRQAAIGPGIGAFSRYRIVREADDSPMRVSTALALINKEVDALLSEGTEDLDAETRFALQWHQQHGYAERKGGSGDAIAQLLAFNLSEAQINASGLFRAKGGSAKLLTRDEMHEAVLARYGQPWRPSLDDAFTVWELAQHMARALLAEEGGVGAAGRLLAERRVNGPDVLLVAERMFELATNRKENDEALVWNQLQTSWPEIESAADRAEEAGLGQTAKPSRDLFDA